MFLFPNNCSKGIENQDFDLPYAYLLMAMAFSLNNSKKEAGEHLKEAKKLGANITGEQDKKIFQSDLKDAVERLLAGL